MNTDNTDPFAPKTGSRNAFGKDAPIGHVVTGVVLETGTMQQTDFDTGLPKSWDDGSPMMMSFVKLQTELSDDDDDDGIRTCYAKGGKTIGAARGRTMEEAIRAAGIAAKSPIKPGGTLTIRYLEDGEPKKRGFNGPKLYDAKYVPADPFAAKPPARPALGYL
jgi:hypothetical protein